MAKQILVNDETKHRSLAALAAHLDEKGRSVLFSNAEFMEYHKDEAVCSTGDVAQYLYCVVEGLVRVLHDDGIQRRILLMVLNAGCTFGYRPYFARHNCINTVTAVETVVLCRVPNEVIMDLMQGNHDFAQYMMEQLAQASCEVEQHYLKMSGKHLRGRLADTLLYLLKTVGTQRDLPMVGGGLKREDLADMSGMTVANAIRTLSSFASEGLIEIDKRTIWFCDIPALKRISQME